MRLFPARAAAPRLWAALAGATALCLLGVCASGQRPAPYRGGYNPGLSPADPAPAASPASSPSRPREAPPAATAAAGASLSAPSSAHASPPPAVAASAPLPAATLAAAPSQLQQPARPARVQVSAAGLTVRADNSDLSQVLRAIAAATGMKYEGFSHDERVFGTYGPAVPREVLSQLLDGAGYNVLMFGGAENEVPARLILSQRRGGGAGPQPTQNTSRPAEEDDVIIDNSPPGAAPDSQPDSASPSQPADDGTRVPTPQELLEQLQHMRAPAAGAGAQPGASGQSVPK